MNTITASFEYNLECDREKKSTDSVSDKFVRIELVIDELSDHTGVEYQLRCWRVYNGDKGETEQALRYLGEDRIEMLKEAIADYLDANYPNLDSDQIEELKSEHCA